jgi:uncharacterized damage-inducible protein DinB
MFTTIKDLQQAIAGEAEGTQKILGALTDASLAQSVAHDHRTLGRMAWHIVTSLPEMCKHAGLEAFSVKDTAPLPKSAAEIQSAYTAVSGELLAQIAGNWSDSSLHEVRNFYGMDWKLGFAMEVLLRHEIHHRGQMTVLMRQAGLKVPGVYGPAKEEWAGIGMQPPEV